VVWISGLPGSGKTTLAASYIKWKQIPAIWYQMDRTDHDPATFFYYMTEAVRQSAAWSGAPLPRLSPEYYANLSSYSVQYFRKLFSSVKKPLLLVLDNYHEVPPESGLHNLVNAGLEQVPQGLNIIVLSRASPPPAMTRLVINRKIGIIGPEELSLTSEESLGIAGLHDKWKSAIEFVPEILEHTKGWTAGFVIMLAYGDPGQEPDPASKEISRELFFNYFAGEIFDKMEPEIRSFLLRASCLPSFTPEDARELTGFAGAGRVLAEMYRKNYFTEKKVQSGTSYQFHPLFREFLLSRNEKESDPGEMTELYRKAADILVLQGSLEDAFQLYAQCRDHGAQADLIRSHAQSLTGQGRLQLVEQWLCELPAEVLSSDPWLLFWHGQCRLPFDPFSSRHLLIRAYERFREQADTAGSILSVTGITETILTEWGDFKELDPWIDELNLLMKGAIDFPARELELRAVIAMFSALMFRQPHHPDMKLWEARMFRLVRSDGPNNLRLIAGNYLSHYYYWLGEMYKAGAVIDIMNALLETAAVSPLDFMTVKMEQAVHGWFIADFQASLEAVNRGLEEAGKSGVHLLDYRLLAQSVYARLSLDDARGAKNCLDRMKPVLNSRHYLDISHFYHLSGMYHLQQRNMEQAFQYSMEALRISREMGTPFPEGLNAITAAQICFETGDEKKAQELTARARIIGRDMQSHLLHMLSHLNEAYFSLKTGRREYAREGLRKTLMIRKEKGIVNFPGWRPDIMTELYAEALETEIEVDFVREDIRSRNLLPTKPSIIIENWPWRVKIFTMGRFEAVIDGEPLRFKGKPPLKPLELLKAVIALGGREVALGRLEDLLWPQAEGDKARQALTTTLHRLRKLIGCDGAVELGEMKLSLNDRICWVDVWALDHLYGRIDEALAAGGFDSEEVVRLTEMILILYKGDFLKNEEAHAWAWPAGTRLRRGFLHSVGLLARAWEREGSLGKSVDLYLRGLEVDALSEEFYQGLMRCYQLQGRTAEGLLVYERLRDELSALKISPGPETESLFLSLRRQNSRNRP
jgi:DNA-binding SARP family transcriptional activator